MDSLHAAAAAPAARQTVYRDDNELSSGEDAGAVVGRKKGRKKTRNKHKIGISSLLIGFAMHLARTGNLFFNVF
jgi:uncharacterized membrane protein YebE (DUF533 family)